MRGRGARAAARPRRFIAAAAGPRRLLAVAVGPRRLLAAAAGPRRLLAAAAGGGAALALAACGTPSPDLFIAERDGNVTGAKLYLLISDTTVRCNHGDARPLTSKQTIEARDITDDLLAVQSGKVDYPKPPPAQIFYFKITDEKGTLRFPDTAQRPPVLPRTAQFVRRLAIDTCKLTR
ncbi:MAG: hypothetical protein QOJ46_156 [bacterium]